MKYQGLDNIDQGPETYETPDIFIKQDVIEPPEVFSEPVSFHEALDKFKDTVVFKDRYQTLKDQIDQLIADCSEDVDLLDQAKELATTLYRLQDTNLSKTRVKSTVNIQFDLDKLNKSEPTFEIDSSPSNKANFVEIESRINKLERMVGTRDLFENGNLSKTLDEMEHKLSMLTDTSLSQDIMDKAKRLESIKKDSNHDLDYLYSTYKKLEPMIHLLPNLLVRLKSLKLVHQESFELASKIKQIQRDQQDLIELATNIKETQAILMKNMQENQHQVMKNIKLLEGKLSSVKR